MEITSTVIANTGIPSGAFRCTNCFIAGALLPLNPFARVSVKLVIMSPEARVAMIGGIFRALIMMTLKIAVMMPTSAAAVNDSGTDDVFWYATIDTYPASENT